MKRGEIAHNVSRGSFYLGVEKATALVSGLVYSAIVLRWLGPYGYGVLSLALAFAGFATLATGNLEDYLERFAAEFQAKGQLAKLRSAHRLALLIKLGLGVLAGGLLVGLAPWLAVRFNAEDLDRLLQLLVLIVVFDGLTTTGRATLYGLQRFQWLAGLAAAFHVLKIIMVLTLWSLGRGAVALATGLSVLTALQGLALSLVPWWLLRRARGGEESGSQLREMVSYCAPMLGARMAFLSGQNLSKIVLGKLFDPTWLGYFSFAFQTIERFADLARALPSSLMPSLTHLVARNERERLRFVFEQAFRLIAVAACALSFGLFVFAPEITLIIGGPTFAPAIPLLRIMALVPIVRIAHQPLTMIFQALRRPGTILALAVIKFGVEFGCYFLIVPLLGLAGAGWANFSGAALSFVIGLVLLARAEPEGAGARTRSVISGVLLLAPLLASGLALDRLWGGPAATIAKLMLVPLAAVGAFALGLVTRYDLEKISSLPLPAAWLRRIRDAAVTAGDRLARAVAPRRA